MAADLTRPATSLKARWGIEGNWKLIVPGAAFVESPQVTRRFEEYEPNKWEELYNLAVDPHENNNVAAAHPDRVKRLYAAIDQWWPAK